MDCVDRTLPCSMNVVTPRLLHTLTCEEFHAGNRDVNFAEHTIPVFRRIIKLNIAPWLVAALELRDNAHYFFIWGLRGRAVV